MRRIVGTTGLIAALAAALLLPAGPAGATFPGANGRIAFAAVPDGEIDGEIFTATQNGSGVVQLTDDTDEDSHPSWSPDGVRIAFSSGGDIFTMAADGTDVQLVIGTPADEFSPVWSPFGNRIVYVARSSGDTELYSINPNGSGRFRMTRDKIEQFNHEWSPLGAVIAFEGTGPGNLDIYTIKPNGNDQQRLTTSLDNESGPTWSPDGAKLAYARQESGDPGENIWRMKANGKGQTRLTNTDAAVDLTPSWSPDGKRIIFVAAQGGDRSLRRVSPSGGVIESVDVGPLSVADPDWQRLPL